MNNKDFASEFHRLYEKYKSGENFSFTRFSDGELFIMQGKRILLSDDKVVIDQKVHNFGYTKEDHKDFQPERDKYITDAVNAAYKHKQKNYYVGLSCRCCVGDEDCDWMKEQRGDDDEYLTYSNLFVNQNYLRFLKYMVPEFKKRKCVVVCNENSNIDGLRNIGIDVVKSFSIGTNAIVNNFNLPEEIEKWIDDNEIKDHTFLLAATSISNLIAHRCFSKNPNNTFLDVGSTLNKFLGMAVARGYLDKFWNLNMTNPEYYKYCIWDWPDDRKMSNPHT
jgi:hypothetical protein